MLTKIEEFVKANKDKSRLAIIILLVALLFFFLGYICAKLQEKQPLKIMEEGMNTYLINI